LPLPRATFIKHFIEAHSLFTILTRDMPWSTCLIIHPLCTEELKRFLYRILLFTIRTRVPSTTD